MLDSGQLVYERYQADGSFQGRHHERMNQYHGGLRVFGGQIVWQKQSGLVLSVTGNLYDDIGINTTPSLTASQAEAHALKLEGQWAFGVGAAELMVLPLADGYVLAYHVLTRSPDALLQVSFIDAHSGERVLTWNDIRTQYEGVGLGIGTWGDRKKMTAEQAVGTYRAVDTIRPFGIKTYDMNSNFLAWLRIGREGNDLYLASDLDNDWRDGAVVDAHAYAGYTYDYYFKRHNRRGLDDRGLVARNYVHVYPPYHPGNYNAGYFPYFNEVVYGDGDGEIFAPFSSAIDTVAHELTHGVVSNSSNLIYRNESGALDEAICDIMAAAVEFLFQPVGDERLMSDWFAGEDVFIDPNSAFRVLSDPKRDPLERGHYSKRYTGSRDNGGVHINSTIVSHAFYLMVMGGTNRTSGVSVNGVGFENMDRMERIFYRGFMYYLVPSSNFSDAREATIRAARELYGAGGVEEQTARAGWNAVGVQ